MLREFTIRQLIIMFGLARKLTRKEIAPLAQCSQAYISKCTKSTAFMDFYGKYIRRWPVSRETAEYKGLPTIYQQIAEFIYETGITHEKLNDAETETE